MLLPISEIKINTGRREADPAGVQELADSLSKVGLLNPITVDRAHTLIAGLHRLEAAKRLGWTEIACTVSSLEGLLAELAEVDENVIRKGLPAVEYSDLLLRRKEIYETLHPETKNGGDRKSEKIRSAKCTSDSAKSFVEDTAERLGVDPSTVRRQIQTAKNLTAEAKGIIRDTGTKITKKDALKLSRLEPEHQKDAASQLASGEIRSVDQYRPVPAGEVQYATFEESVADLKNDKKDRSRTPDTFFATLSFFLQRFCQGVKNYAAPEYEAVFPALTQTQLDQIHHEIHTVCASLNELFSKMERKSER